jgi:hypothetical protein
MKKYQGVTKYLRGDAPKRPINLAVYADRRSRIAELVLDSNYVTMVYGSGGKECALTLPSGGMAFHYGKEFQSSDFLTIDKHPVVEFLVKDSFVVFRSKFTGDKPCQLLGLHFTLNPAQAVFDPIFRPRNMEDHLREYSEIISLVINEGSRLMGVQHGESKAVKAQKICNLTNKFLENVPSVHNPQMLRLSNADKLLDEWKGNPSQKARMRKKPGTEPEQKKGSPPKRKRRAPQSPEVVAETKRRRQESKPRRVFRFPSEHVLYNDKFASAGVDRLHELLGECQKALLEQDADRLSAFGSQFHKLTDLMGAMLRTHEKPRSASLGGFKL